MESVHVDSSLAATSPDLREGPLRFACDFSDDGMGMTREVMERIFEPFFYYQGTERRNGPSACLFVRGILKNHDARHQRIQRVESGNAFSLCISPLPTAWPGRRSLRSRPRRFTAQGRAHPPISTTKSRW